MTDSKGKRHCSWVYNNSKGKRKPLPKKLRDLMKAHINTQKLKWNVKMITDVFLDQKRVNLCSKNGTTFLYCSHGAIFTVCSHTFTLFWSRKTFVIFKTFQLSFCVFVCTFDQEISSFFWCFLFLFLLLCYPNFGHSFPHGL
jgi:hypothetical protein